MLIGPLRGAAKGSARLLELAARAEALLEGVSGGAFLFGVQAYTGVARVLLATGEPERSERLVRPVLAAAERSSWHEAVALSELVLGLSLEARGGREQACAALGRAAERADEHQILAPAWEAHAALTRLTNGAGEHRAAADAIVERMAGSLSDDALRASLRERAKL